MSSKLRVQKYRSKLKENSELYSAHLEKERSRDAERRKKKQKDLEKNSKLHSEFKKKESQRKKTYRLKKKLLARGNELTQDQLNNSYNCTQTLGKAIKKVKNALPNSPSKKKQ